MLFVGLVLTLFWSHSRTKNTFFDISFPATVIDVSRVWGRLEMTLLFRKGGSAEK